MNDTPKDIVEKQREIIHKKSKSERFIIGAELIDFGWSIMEERIRKEHQKISETGLKIEIFKQCYSSAFKPDEKEKIIASIIHYHKNKTA
jgi:hypothetical protein